MKYVECRHRMLNVWKQINNNDINIFGKNIVKIDRWRMNIVLLCQEYKEELYKNGLNDPNNHLCDHSPQVRHPVMWRQVGLKKHYYEQS